MSQLAQLGHTSVGDVPAGTFEESSRRPSWRGSHASCHGRSPARARRVHHPSVLGRRLPRSMESVKEHISMLSCANTLADMASVGASPALRLELALYQVILSES